MAANSVDLLLNEFIEAWNAGQRPRVDDYIERAPNGERAELAGLIGAFLEIAPTPNFSQEQLEEIRRDPTVQAVVALIDSHSGLWPALLPRLRERAKLTRDQVVGQLAELLRVAGREPKVKRYYHEMESGTIEPRGVSRKVLEGLGKIFTVDVGELERAGDFQAPAPGAPAAAHMRTETREEVRAAEVTAAPSPPDAWDEVDELFRGGR